MVAADGEIRIVIADDQVMFREALRRVLHGESGLRVVADAGNGSDALRLVHKFNPDVLLINLSLPNLSGMEVLRRLSGEIVIRTIVLNATIEKEQLVEALQHGARAIILKNLPAGLLVKVIHEVMNGGCWVDRGVVADLVQTLRQGTTAIRQPGSDDYFGLTERQREIVAAVVDGFTNRDIARHFSISEQTVKHHLTSIFEKVGVDNRLELALFAMNHDLVA